MFWDEPGNERNVEFWREINLQNIHFVGHRETEGQQ